MSRETSALVILLVWLSGCASSTLYINGNHPRLEFSDLKSELEVVDADNLGCGGISAEDIGVVLVYGVLATPRDVHDHYSYTKCTTAGTVKKNGVVTEFSFDFGGIVHLSDGTTLACGAMCCRTGTEFCTYESDGLK